MNGDAELPHRSSSPLKRRASNMEHDPDAHKNGDDSEMTATQAPGEENVPPGGFPRAMSVDIPEADASKEVDDITSQRKSDRS